MSKFEDLPNDAKVEALRHLNRASFAAAIGAYAILIGRGLLSPDEFSAVIQPVIDEFGQAKHVGVDDLDMVIDKLAVMKSLAAKTWTGK